MNNCEEERRVAFANGRRMGFWLAKNESKWRKDIQQKERRADVAVMRQQEGALEGLSDVFGRAEESERERDAFKERVKQLVLRKNRERAERRALPAPVSALSAPLAPPPVQPPAPSPAPSARQRLASFYTDERLRTMNKDDARSALRALGGNPRRQGSRDYMTRDEVVEQIRQRR